MSMQYMQSVFTNTLKKYYPWVKRMADQKLRDRLRLKIKITNWLFEGRLIWVNSILHKKKKNHTFHIAKYFYCKCLSFTQKKKGVENYFSTPFLVGPLGIEPSTYWLWVSCSNRMSYRTDNFLNKTPVKIDKSRIFTK